MQIEYEELTREVDNRIAAIDLNGKHIIRDCKAMLVFLKEKLTELKVFVQSEPFRNDTDEIDFFKQYKPKILGPLFYFHHILRIESQRPLDEKELDGYYEKQQEEQKMFFDRHVAFSNTTAAGQPIWTITISCVEGKETQLMWMFANTTMIRSSQRDMTALSPASWQWKCCMPSCQ